MDLETWLSSIVDGKKLQMALTRCEDAMIESLADLVDLYESRGGGEKGRAELERAFPVMLAVKIDNALVKLANDGVESLTTDHTDETEPKVVATTQSIVKESASTTNEELPAGKR